MFFFFFFFSSRRRHTRLTCEWSSDVCSSDLTGGTANGKALFSENCASCHTLAAADASGKVGPNLDEAKPPKPVVVKQVTNGGGGMPAFGGRLSTAQIEA